MDIVKESFDRLYPNRNTDYNASIKFSGRLKPYNANVQINKFSRILRFNLSKSWKYTNREILIGLIQSLLIKIFKDKKSTINIDLYNNFVKNLHLSVPKTEIDPLLLESFNRVNDEYFYGLIEMPNLMWGNASIAKLGSYEYQTDKITISSIFKNAPLELLDYIMYHEILHKKHKFEVRGARNYHHTHDFKKAEKNFKNALQIEKELKKFCKKARIKRIFFG
jgi:predicted metal-dependent hydrolase